MISNYNNKRIVMTTVGSFGDINPYIALALEMKDRNLSPVIATSENYRQNIEGLGIEFHPVRPVLPGMDTPAGVEMVEKVMDVQKGAEYLFKTLLVPAIRDSYDDLIAATAGADLLVTHPITMAGPLVAQTTGIPWISTVLAPSSLWSAYDPMVPPTAPWLRPLLMLAGPTVARWYQQLIEQLTDSWVQEIYDFRRELGLPKGQHPLFAGQYSPELNIALFSKAFYERQEDWPENTITTGFPFYDKKDGAPMDRELAQFLAAGPAPVVFTLGSAAVHVAGDFFQQSIVAASALKLRAVLLIGSEENRPKSPLPEGIVAFNYAPYGDLLPRCAAMVHQGGVGTTAQGLRAGVPMLVMPYNHDQPDNAARVERLGVARTISRKAYKATRVAKELTKLLGNQSYRERAREAAYEILSERGAAAAVELMLNVLNNKPNQESSSVLRTVA